MNVQSQKLPSLFSATVCLFLVFTLASSAFAQTPPARTCLPVSERAGREVGCWIMASESLGRLSQPAVLALG
jgi:hypothetical protein